LRFENENGREKKSERAKEIGRSKKNSAQCSLEQKTARSKLTMPTARRVSIIACVRTRKRRREVVGRVEAEEARRKRKGEREEEMSRRLG
jgi:hypothetical protein